MSDMERNKKLTGSRLTMNDYYTYERAAVIEWLDGEAQYVWSPGGSTEPREPTIAEVQAWLTGKQQKDAP